MPLFSVIIPLYNTETYIGDCLESIIGQGFRDIEIILVNDCSTDKSGEIAEAYASRYDFVTVLHHEKNLGVSISRNDGIGQARGSYVLFIDSDDRIFDGSLIGLKQLAEDKPGTDVIICRVISQHGEYSNKYMFDDAIIGTTDPDKYIAHLNRDNFHPETCWHYAVRREFLVKNDLYFAETKIAEDQEFVARLLCSFETFALYTGDYYWYRERDHSLKKSMDFEAGLSLLSVANNLCDYSKNKSLSPSKREFLRLRIKHALSLFSARLIMLEDEDVKRLSGLLGEFEGNLDMLIEGFQAVNLKAIIDTRGLGGCLVEYRDTVIENLIARVDSYKFESIYLYCTGLIGKATARILVGNGYQVSGVLDDNETLDGHSMDGINIHTRKILDRKSNDDLENTLIIVCNQKDMLFENIKNNLVRSYEKAPKIIHNLF
jgi:glycosyltransferase involved in cell wall biosynthesis